MNGIWTMNWQAIGAVGEVLGGFAVFISLLYLALQIRSSRRTDQIVAAAAAASAVDEWIGQIVRDEGLFELHRRGQSDYESLSREEKGRFSLLMIQFLRRMETIWTHRQLGAIEAGYWSGMEVSIRKIVGTIGGTRSFNKYSDTLNPEFARLVKMILDDNDSTEHSTHNIDTAA